ncbi:propanol-preferring alcohol dehydrogenase [Xanthomonas arboricola]|nr:propanol-preferring alcohol dehydrogenase [Xanthomonas arboricola]
MVYAATNVYADAMVMSFAAPVTVLGSLVGSRLDLQESLSFAEQAKVAATVQTDRFENINDVFIRMHQGTIEGRVVLSFAD